MHIHQAMTSRKPPEETKQDQEHQQNQLHKKCTQEHNEHTSTATCVTLVTLQHAHILHPRIPLMSRQTQNQHPPNSKRYRRTDSTERHMTNEPDIDHLKHINPHDNDQHINFDTSSHTYFWKGAPAKASVTQLIHHFAQKFDAQATIDSMRNGNHWPREQYVNQTKLANIKPEDLERLPSHLTNLKHLLQQNPKPTAQLCLHINSLRQQYPQLNEWCQQFSFTDEEILQNWNQRAEEAAQKGTNMHRQFELLFNGEAVPGMTHEIKLLIIFCENKLRGNRIFRTEWQVYSEQYDLAGTIDCVAETPTGDKILIDWKRTSNIWRKHESYGKYMKPPIQHIPDSPLWHYRLQLNMYRHILQTDYNQKVKVMYIVCTHPDNEQQPWIDEVPLLEQETTDILRNRPWKHAD